MRDIKPTDHWSLVRSKVLLELHSVEVAIEFGVHLFEEISSDVHRGLFIHKIGDTALGDDSVLELNLLLDVSIEVVFPVHHDENDLWETILLDVVIKFSGEVIRSVLRDFEPLWLVDNHVAVAG